MPLLAFLLLTLGAPKDPIDRYLQREMERNHIPGLAVAVVQHGKILKLKTYGNANLEWNAPTGPDTRFQLASTSKSFTGAGLMRLVQAGKVDLNESITHYLPNSPASWKDIRVIDLANHASGIPSSPPLDPSEKISGVLSKLKGIPVAEKPGVSANYNSSDFVVLSALIEQVSEQSFPTFLQKNVFDPAHLTDTGFDFATEGGPIRTAEILPKKSRIYRWDGQALTDFEFLYPAHAYGAGGGYSSIRDMARWAVALDRNDFLSQASKRTMWTARRLNSGKLTQWGIGWVVRTYEGRPTAGHSGGPALSDVLHFLSEDLTIIVLQNQQRLYPYLAQGVADRLLPPTNHAHPALPTANPWDLTCRSFVKGLSHGQLDMKIFSPDQEDLAEDVRNLLIPYAQSQDPLDSLRFIEKNGDDVVYEASYGKKLVQWWITFDSNGKVAGLDVQTL